MNAKFEQIAVNVFALGLVAAAAGLLAFKHHQAVTTDAQAHLLNVSYDPTRELYARLNPQFIDQYKKETGETVAIEQSHGGSSKQARAVAEGTAAADIVTLALPSDIDSLRARGLVADQWQSLFPNHSQPYYSTIVFLVRRGNPKHIHDWVDLEAGGIEVITPNFHTSGNGKLSLLAAWGSVINRGGTEAQALDRVTRIYRNVSNQGEGARAATTTFELAKEGDVQLTWENEAIRAVAESNGELAIVYPPLSIRAEPSVALVTANIAKHHTEATARAYLDFLFSDTAQEVLAEQGYRPQSPSILNRHRNVFPEVTLFSVTTLARDWNDAQEKFFGDNGLFNTLHTGTPQ